MLFNPARIPRSTYRLQFSAHLTLAHAKRLVGYLVDLGISDAYPSPLFRAREGSAHGYDVIDPGQIDPQLGSQAEFQAFAEELCRCGMGLLMDVVPNHMGIDDVHNVWWQDVLESGPSSIYAKFFDIDWHPPKEMLHGKVLLPFLGDQYGKVLENRELRLVYENQLFRIAYYDRRFPVAPRTWRPVLELVLELVSPGLDPQSAERMELESVITALGNLPDQGEQDPARIHERYREKEVARRRLAALCETSEPIRRAIDQAVEQYNGTPGEPRSFDRLEALLAEQAYRLAYWRVATDEINYRRFFDINGLAAIRVEDPEVFEAVHAMSFEFLAKDWVTGLRIDHSDGLYDPEGYFVHLQERYRALRTPSSGEGDGTGQEAERADHAPSLYLVTEKILAREESLPAAWPVCGTTGYDYLNLLNGLFVEERGACELTGLYSRFADQTPPFADVLYESKRTILNIAMASELNVLAGQLDRISEQHRWSRDFTRASLRRALREVIACFPVYRTYLRPQAQEVCEDDRRCILTAIRAAKRRNPTLSGSFFDFIASVLLLQDPDGLTDEQRQQRRQWVLKFQQVTGPVMAKGLEDTAFYRYYPLASLNEVGGDPSAPGVSVEQYHRAMLERAARSPFTMSATSTHDTKRGEDLRARLNVLSEVPAEWQQAIRRWRTLNERHRGEIDGAPVPDLNEEYLLYQTLVGTWPLQPADEAAREQYASRIAAYMDKALKEAKVHTSWTNPTPEYDQAVARFVRSILDACTGGDFLHDLEEFVRSIADTGYLNSLAQTLLKIVSPGVPDFYQGTELWDFNLVDPDNRRPVDFQQRRQMLSSLQAQAQEDLGGLAADLLAAWPDPRIKMFLIWRALTFRRDHAELFLLGRYVPLAVEGPQSEHAIALAREHEGRWVVCAAPRLSVNARQREPALAAVAAVGIGGTSEPRRVAVDAAGVGPLAASGFYDTVVSLPPETPTGWRHVLTGEAWPSDGGDNPGRSLDLAELFRHFPVALLAGNKS